MSKGEILKKIKTVGTIEGRNSMGVSESFYDPYYLIKTCYERTGDLEKLESMSEEELINLLKLAKWSSEVFY